MKYLVSRGFLNRAITALLLVVATAGCAHQVSEVTRYTWATDPGTALYAAADSSDILVAYNLRIVGGRDLDRRAYWVRANATRPDLSPPSFVPLSATNGLKTISVVSPTGPEPGQSSGWLAAGSPRDGSYVVFRDGRRELEVALPNYRLVEHKPLRALGTTPADAFKGVSSAWSIGAIIGGILGL